MVQFQVPVLQTVQEERSSVIGQQHYDSGFISGVKLRNHKVMETF